MNASEYEITDGYVGSFGISYKPAAVETLNAAIAAAARRNNVTEARVVEMLQNGVKVAWCDSPNYYYDHGVGYIRRKRASQPPPQLVRCSCGHSVERTLVMSASQGTSCPDCYDRMSE
jgi:hypothetical protein